MIEEERGRKVKRERESKRAGGRKIVTERKIFREGERQNEKRWREKCPASPQY